MNQPELIEITDRQSAEGQLETAIVLWFEEKDLSSIHTLATAAQGLLNRMCGERRVESSSINKIIDTNKQGRWLRMPQNFFKHGTDRNDKHKGVTAYFPAFTELVLMDCLSMYQRLFGTLTPVMKLFGLRYGLLNPRGFPTKITVEGVEIEDLRGLTRPEFLKKVLPSL